MTVQEVKEKLGRVSIKYREYMLAEEKAEQFCEMIAMPAPVMISEMPPQESNRTNATENKYIAALWYCEQAGKRFREYMIARQGAEAAINALKFPDEREALTRRYIMFQKWEYIAEKMHISLRHIHRIHGGALVEISENLKDVTECH